ncbi:MAG: glycosyl hydrolase family 8 [Eubacteriales bacterium]|nr:glycosyl hydrolase family 8 [Eubacteriales bacterium]
MRRAARTTALWALALLAAAGSLTGCTVQHTQPPAQSALPATQQEQLCLDFFKAHMITDQGGVRTNYLDTEGGGELATGDEVLSESMGLWMLYTVAIEDEEAFDHALQFVRDYLDTGVILSYRYSAQSGAYPVNAFVDDIRIIRALLLAGEAFDQQYRQTALHYADRLYQTNVKDGCIYDMYDEQLGMTNDFVTLCYLDIDTLRRLGQYDDKWAQIAQPMLDIAAGGYLGDVFPLYAGAYYPADGRYAQADIHTVQALLTALHATQAQGPVPATLDYMKHRVDTGTLYGAYRWDGTATTDTQSTAIYALCAQIFARAGDEEGYAASIRRMDALQVRDAASDVYGAFADATTKQLYAFDNLMALLAYRQE